MANTGYFPLHGQQQQVVGSPPEVPLLLKQSQDRLGALAKWKKGLIDGVDLATTSVNNALSKLQPNTPEFIKLAKYMQRCHEHRDRLIQIMDFLVTEEMTDQKFLGFWLEQRDLPNFPLPPISQSSSTNPTVGGSQVDPRLPIGPDGKPIGVMRADGIVDVTAKSTSLPMNGQLTPEQAAELGVVGPPGPAGSVPVPINASGQLTKEQLAAYTKAEEERAKAPAKNVAGQPAGGLNVGGQSGVVTGIPVMTDSAINPTVGGNGRVG